MKQLIYVIMVCISVLFLTRCKNTEENETVLEVVDKNRHYYPVLQGEEKVMVFPIVNKGKYPFVLSDIMVSCGCVVANREVIQRIPVGEVGQLILKFDTTKNTGYVKHYVSLYGNLGQIENIELTFDFYVIPDSYYEKDYEELFREHKGDLLKDLVDGKENKEYYTD